MFNTINNNAIKKEIIMRYIIELQNSFSDNEMNEKISSLCFYSTKSIFFCRAHTFTF